MRIFKNKAFHRWYRKQGLTDGHLVRAVGEIQSGLVEADLGGHVFKKRIAITGKGKSGGVRTVLAYHANDNAFFIYGFAKNDRANIRDDELRALKKYAAELLAYTEAGLLKAMRAGALIEVIPDEKTDS